MIIPYNASNNILFNGLAFFLLIYLNSYYYNIKLILENVMPDRIKCPKCGSTDCFKAQEGMVCEDCNEIFFIDGISGLEVPDIDPDIIKK